MSWRNIIVTKHSKISFTLNHIVVKTNEDSFQFHIDDLGLILISTTQVVITAHALSECLKHDVKVVFCDEKSLPVGETSSYVTTSSRRANIKKQLSWDEQRKDKLWQKVVQDKINQQARLLALLDENDSALLSKLANDVVTGDPSNREAVAAHVYFPRVFTYEFTRSDDTNPINDLLNYGYSILMSETARRIAQVGYLSEFGIHHDNDRNPFNLASDLMEPFRPVVDRCVHDISPQKLIPDTKETLAKLLQSHPFDTEPTLSSLVNSYVQTSLAFLDGAEKLPELSAT